MRTLPPWAREVALPALVALLGVLELLSIRPDHWGFAAATDVLACACLTQRRRWTVIAPVIAGLVVMSPPLFYPNLDEPATPIFVLVIVLYSLARANAMSRGLLGASLLLAFFAFYFLAVDSDTKDPTDVVFVASLMTPPFVLGRLARKLAEQAEQLRAQQELIRREAVRDERDRIARELHDVIAHSVSAMVVQTAAAQDLLTSDPTRAGELLENVAETGRGALAETGRLLRVIRDDQDELGLAPAPGLSRLDDLVESFRGSGLQVELTIEEPLPALAAGADVSAYRIVQEALTNALKYAPDRAVALRLSEADGRLSIHTSNWYDGRRQDGGGLGLLGMRERLALLGGELTHGVTSEGRFDVTATLPLAVPS